MLWNKWDTEGRKYFCIKLVTIHLSWDGFKYILFNHDMQYLFQQYYKDISAEYDTAAM